MSGHLTIKKTKGGRGGGCYYIVPGSQSVGMMDMYEAVRNNEVEFIGVPEENILLTILNTVETNKESNKCINRNVKGDTQLLNRIIREGGMIEYAKKLEGIDVG